ncbi:MAG: HAMP domain-containing protein [Chloroflexi bacterium]|nr:HAMP domain-containing protein [Chloroflexota bacterium]
MSQRLWVKLLGAFGLIIVLGVVVTVLLTRQGAATQFSHFMLDDQMFTPEYLQGDLAAYYQQQGGWQGIDAAFPQMVRHASSGGMMGGMMGHAMGMFDSRIALLDESGALLVFVGKGGTASEMTASGQNWPIRVDGRQVGTLLIEGQPMMATGGDAGDLLSGVTRAVLIAGLLAGLVAFALAIVLVRQITHPLTTLRDASRRIAQGDLAARVPVQSSDELGQLGGAFNRMASALETQEMLRRNLMADVAHELRTPLTAIQGTVEALQDGIFPFTLDSLDPIHEETLLLGRLVEDLRTLAQAEAGHLSLNVTDVDTEELVERIVTGQLPAVQQAAIRLEWGVDSGVRLRGDAQRIGQVLSNLLSNALRHTPAGGRIEVAVRPQEEGLLFSVLDSGPGIAAADLPHIFDRFYRGDPSRSRGTGGSGLGLTIARQLVEAHAGRIWAESPPPGREKGSVFFVWLPRGVKRET